MVHYEVAISINSGDIVHTNGPYMCGSWPAIKIFGHKLKDMLLPGEMVEADAGYCGESLKICMPVDDCNCPEEHRMKALAINKKFKQFSCLKNVYCHSLLKHKLIFEADVVLHT